MSPLDAAVCIRAIVFAAALWATLQFMVWPTFTSEFRRDLFRLRQRLFLYMADGNISSSDPVYLELVSMINGVIRLADRVTFFRLVCGMVVMKNEGAAYDHHLAELMARHPPEVKEQLGCYHNEIGVAIAKHLLRSSPMTWFVVGLVLMGKLFSKSSQRVRDAKARAFQAVEAEAVYSERQAA